MISEPLDETRSETSASSTGSAPSGTRPQTHTLTVTPQERDAIERVIKKHFQKIHVTD